jgi:hypothetical protein
MMDDSKPGGLDDCTGTAASGVDGRPRTLACRWWGVGGGHGQQVTQHSVCGHDRVLYMQESSQSTAARYMTPSPGCPHPVTTTWREKQQQ